MPSSLKSLPGRDLQEDGRQPIEIGIFLRDNLR